MMVRERQTDGCVLEQRRLWMNFSKKMKLRMSEDIQASRETGDCQ